MQSIKEFHSVFVPKIEILGKDTSLPRHLPITAINLSLSACEHMIRECTVCHSTRPKQAFKHAKNFVTTLFELYELCVIKFD